MVDGLRQQATDRNRLNQRNFRARRQRYVAELEQRIQKLERDGVQITKEVQVAARRVHDENQQLRWLLHTHYGVSDDEITGYLSASKTAPGSILHPASHPTPSAGDDEPPRAKKSVSCPSADASCAPTETGCTDAPQPAHGETPVQSACDRPAAVPTDSPREEVEVDSGSCNIDHDVSDGRAAFDGGSPGRGTPPGMWTDASAGDTSCEEAASIIAGLRGHTMNDEVWTELGCAARRSCRVKNLSVFELMDKV